MKKKNQARHRLRRRRVHHPLPHPVLGRRAGRRHPGHRGPRRETGPRGGRPGPQPPRRRAPRLQVARGDGRRPGHRRRLDRLPELHPARGHGRDRRGRDQRQGRAHRHRLREAARPECRRGQGHADPGPQGRAARRLPREPGLLAGRRPGQGDHLGAGSEPLRPALPGPGRRGAQRASHALVLGGDAPGRGRAQRHDVPLRRGGPLHAHSARGEARGPQAGQGHGLCVVPQVAGTQVRQDPGRQFGREDGLSQAAGRGLRPLPHRVQGPGGPDARRRDHDVLVLRRRRAAAQPGASRPRILAGHQHPRLRAQDLPQSERPRRGRRGPRGEAERRGRPDARRRLGGDRIRLHGREPAHGPVVPRGQAARGEFQRRPQRHRAPDDRLHERRGGQDRALPAARPRDVHPGRGPRDAGIPKRRDREERT